MMQTTRRRHGNGRFWVAKTMFRVFTAMGVEQVYDSLREAGFDGDVTLVRLGEVEVNVWGEPSEAEMRRALNAEAHRVNGDGRWRL